MLESKLGLTNVAELRKQEGDSNKAPGKADV